MSVADDFCNRKLMLAGMLAFTQWPGRYTDERDLMSKQEREHIVPFVVTSTENLDEEGIVCSYCGKFLRTTITMK